MLRFLPARLHVWLTAPHAVRADALREFLWFGLKEAASCSFAGGFFLLLAASRVVSTAPVPRYDAILLGALALQAAMLWTRLETRDELKTIALFHLLGFALEAFKSNPAIGSWSYPEFAYSKLLGVPLYAGFMYASVASYMVQAWRFFDLRLRNAPDPRLSAAVAIAIYANFFTHHFLPDLRWLLTLLLLALFRRTRVYFTPWRRRLWMPLPLAFVLIGFFLWVAENAATFLGAWTYPDQHLSWRMVHAGKIGSWALLVVMTFVIVADLKDLKMRLHRASSTAGRIGRPVRDD
ncbi:DUF817 domain-containing protein [Oleiagrimonas soli]|uniref:Uncharacterized membrane protein YoaT (DUF817 family) n=1 Tax=Oleiagrimonas soli TaxID=1543381 RepID=A0A841KGT3_9GAMM|nr:DUF817 domain-containing protein [Oleiagrimonas soli]MBB6184833.1 uncharacterized membrane protein YoaT (DUF817 family) [Oleiagrimonas soli]